MQTKKNPNIKIGNNKLVCTACSDKEKMILPGFNALITKTLVPAFSSIIGDANKKAFYPGLSSCFGIRKMKIPRNIKGFSNAPKQIFGRSVYLLEGCTVQTLYKKTPRTRTFCCARRSDVHGMCRKPPQFLFAPGFPETFPTSLQQASRL